MTAAWRGLVDQLTYGVDLRARVADEIVVRIADALVEQHGHRHPVAEYDAAAAAALGSGGPVAPPDADEEATQDFLVRLRERLGERRPWTAAPFAPLETSAWATVGSAPTVGTVPLRRREVGARLNLSFGDVDDGGSPSKVVVLRLRSGEVVGLRMSTDPRTPGAAVLTHDDPAATVTALRELTGMPVDPPGPERAAPRRS